MDIVSSTAQDFEGFVEAIVDGSIYGWVNLYPIQFSLSAVLGGVVIGIAEEFLPRDDLKSKPLAKGFSIKCSVPVTPADLVSGELKVVLISSHNIASLPIWRPLWEAGNFLNINLADLNKAWNSVPAGSKKAIAQDVGIVQGGREFGRMSSDGVVQAGRNGYLFLLAGRNHISKFYTDNIELDIQGWLACFLRRQECLNTLGIKYIQVVIPEKSSVYYEYAPFTANAGSSSYLDLINLSLESDVPICNILPRLLGAKDARPVYLQADTHLSTFGAEIVVNAILELLGESIFYDTPLIDKVLRVGDLGERFVEDGDIQELVSMYKDLQFGNIDTNIELILSRDPENGHQGRQRVWRNSAAPIKKIVVCFGGSSFERGENSGNLSWWFARLFSEFHFIWSPDFDVDYVGAISPDIVICQSIERFLTEVPAS